MKTTPVTQKTEIPEAVRQWFSAHGKIIGAKGGRAGTGKAKQRGGKTKAERAAYYRRIQKLGDIAKRKKKLAQAAAERTDNV